MGFFTCTSGTSCDEQSVGSTIPLHQDLETEQMHSKKENNPILVRKPYTYCFAICF